MRPAIFHMRPVLVLLFFMLHTAAHSQQFADMGKEWRGKEEWRAHGLFNKHDLSPIDEAFAMKEVDLLWDYYSLAKNRQFGHPRSATPEEINNTRFTDQEEKALNLEVSQRTLTYLEQLPGLARYMGDRIELLADTKGMDQKRYAAFDCLSLIGNDESIVELGRFIFDDRDPDYAPSLVPGGSNIGVSSPIKYYATGAFGGALRGKYSIVEEVSAQFGMKPDWFEKIQNWWLTSDEAAPYRRKLADAGVVLPPGYPPMAELKGAKTTIAPSTTSSPVPAVKR